MTMTALTHIVIALIGGLILAAILVCIAASNLINDDNREDNDQ